MKNFASFPIQSIPDSGAGNNTAYISVQSMGRTVFLSPDIIMFLKGEGNYTYIYISGGKKYLVSKTLKSLICNLKENFIRVHKSYVVNMDYVVERIEADRLLKMSCGKEVSVSRRKIKEISGILDHTNLLISA